MCVEVHTLNPDNRSIGVSRTGWYDEKKSISVLHQEVNTVKAGSGSPVLSLL
jgi:hypothetical protein